MLDEEFAPLHFPLKALGHQGLLCIRTLPLAVSALKQHSWESRKVLGRRTWVVVYWRGKSGWVKSHVWNQEVKVFIFASLVCFYIFFLYTYFFRSYASLSCNIFSLTFKVKLHSPRSSASNRQGFCHHDSLADAKKKCHNNVYLMSYCNII